MDGNSPNLWLAALAWPVWYWTSLTMILFHSLWNGIKLASSQDCGLFETVGESCYPHWAEVSLGGDRLALHPKACLHELMCIAVWLREEGAGFLCHCYFSQECLGKEEERRKWSLFLSPCHRDGPLPGRLFETVPKCCWFRAQGTKCHTEQGEDKLPPLPFHSAETKGQPCRSKGTSAESMQRAVV